jgi:peroxiredoxin/uncharacterized membrane protein YphA (DoxX/SURF4 family)
LLNNLLTIGRIVLATVFGVAGVAKLVDPAGSRKSVVDFGVPPVLAAPLGSLLPFLELTCAVSLLLGDWAWFGAIGALAILLVFMAGIAISLARGRRPDCHCFGQLHSAPVGWTTLSRNAVLAAVAGFIVWQGPVSARANLVQWLGAWSLSDTLMRAVLMIVATIAAFELWALLQVLRQNGRLLLRLDALEAKVGIGVTGEPPAGLPVGSPPPRFSLKNLKGEAVTLDMLRERDTPLLLFFTEPDCGACDAALPDLARWQGEHADRLLIVPITRGSQRANSIKAREHNLDHVLLQVDREVAEAYRVQATPSAVVVKEGLIGSPLAVGIDAIRALVVEATLPPPLKRGDRVPSLRLRDLGGGIIDLATLTRNRTLLLFWNPSCGFCQAMLDDLKAWEGDRSKAPLELVVISAGSPAAIREQGFRSRVLLDPDFRAGQAFGADGTPSAVVLDEEGRVASEIGVGPEAVLTLARAVPAGTLVPV